MKNLLALPDMQFTTTFRAKRSSSPFNSHQVVTAYVQRSNESRSGLPSQINGVAIFTPDKAFFIFLRLVRDCLRCLSDFRLRLLLNELSLVRLADEFEETSELSEVESSLEWSSDKGVSKVRCFLLDDLSAIALKNPPSGTMERSLFMDAPSILLVSLGGFEGGSVPTLLARAINALKESGLTGFFPFLEAGILFLLLDSVLISVSESI